MALTDYVVFCDFDGTITLEDTTDQLLEQYADPRWKDIEQEWLAGKIGSRDCLKKQIDCLPLFSSQEFEKFISRVKIDSNFLAFYNFIKTQKIDLYIVSDGLDLFIKEILKTYNLGEIPLFSNHLNWQEGRFNLSFPFYREDCHSGAGMCKCRKVKEISAGRHVIYIGDGRSDFCAAKHAEIIFAKGKLIEECARTNRACIPFENFQEVANDLMKRILPC
ncbi:MAG: MtnX-like HAD-IB family phosphatase [Pseudomonadota bacterium]